jgi:hypothetical protein
MQTLQAPRLCAAAVYLGLDRCGLLQDISFILVSSRVAFPNGFAPGAGDPLVALQLILNMQLAAERGHDCAVVLLCFTEQIPLSRHPATHVALCIHRTVGSMPTLTTVLSPSRCSVSGAQPHTGRRAPAGRRWPPCGRQCQSGCGVTGAGGWTP